jgi:hypothetical protein
VADFKNNFCGLPLDPEISEVEFPPLPPIPITESPQSSQDNHMIGNISSEISSLSFCLPSCTPPVPRISEDLMMTFLALPEAPPIPVVVLPP